MSNLSILSKEIRTHNNLYSLNDLHKASGNNKNHQPAFFMRVDQTKELIDEINRSANMQIAVETKRGGANQGTWVCKELVYAYAMWISAKFHLQVIRAFDAMTQGQQYDLDLSRYHFPLETASPSDRQFQNAIMTPQRLLSNRAPEMELLTMLENDGYNVDGVKVRLESLYHLAEYQAFYNEMFTELHESLDRVTQMANRHRQSVWGNNVNFTKPLQRKWFDI
ncbi:hypothetical protein CTH30272_02092 [Allocatenococcus thiocycli]|nr:hypothetical protein CTH30272_02092 [Catenococcus thiocycli]